ncbi:NAD-P-binding protein [Pilatotrama ljubarskyi]|nr:NAD-P-binding protein [Pilatotrama ljubarskyi]
MMACILQVAVSRPGGRVSSCTLSTPSLQVLLHSLMPANAAILVTGASGFIGSHVTLQLLDAGYRVKGTARGTKVDLLRDRFGSYTDFKAVAIDNIATGDFTDVFQDAIIHLASPLAARESPESALNSAINGTLNVLRQAEKAGVSKVVLTSSWATTLDPSLVATFAGVTFTEKDWGVTSREDVMQEGRTPLYVYCATKILAELAAWRFAEEHRGLDLATVNPPFVYGKPVDGLTTGAGITSLGTNALIYQLIAGEPGRPLPPQLPPYYCNVRDVARAHVLALDLPKLPAGADVQEKRFIVAGPGAMLWTDAVKFLHTQRPELKDRLPSLEDSPPLPGPLSKVDTTRAADVLGMNEYIGWEDTLLETVDALIEAEKRWK